MEITSKLTKTKWGYVIKVNEGWNLPGWMDGKMAHLEYGGNHSEFNTDTSYICEIFYKLGYAEKPQKSKKDWMTLKANTIEEICHQSEFREFNLDKKKINPWFRIVREQ